MSGRKRKKPNLGFMLPAILLLALLAAMLLLLFERAGQTMPASTTEPAVSPMPTLAPTSEPTPTPLPTPTPEPTPCGHLWNEGVCELCGERCIHEKHDRNSAICLQCGMQCRHHYESALCTGCRRFPVTYNETLPEEYYLKSEEPGTHRREYYTYRGSSYPLAIWLPRDYSEDVKHNVILLMPGDKSYYNAWIDADLTSPNGKTVYCMSDVYDHIAEEHLCDPFIVVGISNFAGMDESGAGRWICEGILPYIAENYSTWAEDGSSGALKAAREHFAIGGLSRGSIQTYDVGMCWCLEYFANFACFSNMSNADPVAGCLNNVRNRDLSICCYYATWGSRDKEEYRVRQKEGYLYIVEHVERLTRGENAFGKEINGDHNWNTWSTSFFDAIQYLFA